MKKKLFFGFGSIVLAAFVLLILAANYNFGHSRSGREIFHSFCTSCHSSGATGAPVIGNSEAWRPRADKGRDLLLEHAINGYRGMPRRGTCGNCSEGELTAAIEYIVGQSGGFPQNNYTSIQHYRNTLSQ